MAPGRTYAIKKNAHPITWCLAIYANLFHSKYNGLRRVDQISIYWYPVGEEFFPGEPVYGHVV